MLNHCFFFKKKTAFSPGGSDGFLKRRIPGKNGEVSPRTVVTGTENEDDSPLAPCRSPARYGATPRFSLLAGPAVAAGHSFRARVEFWDLGFGGLEVQ